MKNKMIIDTLTLEEKASLTSGKDFWQTANIDHAVIPSIFLADGPHGLRKQAVGADHLGLNQSIPSTCFPPAAGAANTFNTSLLNEMGKAIGAEARANKVSVLLGPGINIKRNPRCGRNFEYYSEDPYLAGKLAAAFIEGVQENGISACVKHFAANNQESNRMVTDSIVDERAFREIYLTAFELAVKEGKTKSIMTSYNAINGVYANENKELLIDILRKEWGFEGFVVSDWGGSNDKISSIFARSTLEMPTAGGDTNREVVNAIKNKLLPEHELDETIDDLVGYALTQNKVLEEKTDVNYDKHHQLALSIAEESAVLLKNEGNILPLKAKTKVAIIGEFAYFPRYQGAGSSIVNPTKLDRTIDIFREFDLDYVGISKGFKRYGGKSSGLIKSALNASKNADVVVLYIGLDEITESEGMDRENIKLPLNQRELIDALYKAGKKVVAVLSCGAPIEMDWGNNVSAILHGYLGGQAGARAILNILTGKVNPSGKLGETYPVKYEDVPNYNYFLASSRVVEYRESIFVGYRYYDTSNVRVAYPFGFGLSYTSFEYSNLIIDPLGISVTIKNTGKVYGKEVVELYIGKKSTVLPRPLKELRGFAKVGLNPGEEKNITINFNEYSFRYYDVGSKRFEVESGTYEIYVGASSLDIRLQDKIVIKGTTESPYLYNQDLKPYFVGNVKNLTSADYEMLYGKAISRTDLVFIKRKRIAVDVNTTIAELRYARGWLGRFLSWGIRTAIKLLRGFGQKAFANVLIMGVYNNPIRCLSRLTGGLISWDQLAGLIISFNGRFWKGIGAFFRAGRVAKRERKAAKKAARENK